MSKSISIGLTNLHIALMLADLSPANGAPGSTTYGIPTRVPGAITANFSPNASNDTIFADDGPYDTASTLGAMTLELNVADLPNELRALILGATYDATTGLLIHKSTDVPPYVAVGMSVVKSNGANRLIWYLKGKFAAPDDNNQTKADSINWNTPTITGNFLKRDSDNQWRVSCDTDDSNVKAATKDNWFTTPNVADIESKLIAPVVATATELTFGTDTLALTSTTAGVAISYKQTTDADFITYDTPIATTGWVWDGNEANTTKIISVKATKLNMITFVGYITLTKKA